MIIEASNACLERISNWDETFHTKVLELLVGELSRAWRDENVHSVLRLSEDILDAWPGHAVAITCRLQAAMQSRDTATIASSAFGIARADPQLAWLAIKALMDLDDDAGAARVLIEIQKYRETLPGEDASVLRRLVKHYRDAGHKAEVYENQSEAELAWRTGLQLAPDDPEIKKRMSKVRRRALRTARYAQALRPQEDMAAWDRVVRSDPQNLQGLRRLASIAEGLARNSDAVDYWGRLARLAPDDTEVADRLGTSATLSGREADALVYLQSMTREAAQARIPGLLERVYRACDEALERQDTLGAAFFAKIMRRTETEDATASNNLIKRCEGALLQALKMACDAGDALHGATLAEALLDIDADNYVATSFLARWFHQLHLFDATVRHCERCVTIRPDAAADWILLACVRDRLGDKSGARIARRRGRKVLSGARTGGSRHAIIGDLAEASGELALLPEKIFRRLKDLIDHLARRR